jgi:glutathione synthase/RimK-type ligase-like ATP-grasp enzyme
VWIVKPGENTNRGSGITVCKDFDQIKSIIENKVILKDDKLRSYIVQKYLERPLLINKRKFDIRCYSLITSINGNLCGYWYKDGYIRTA